MTKKFTIKFKLLFRKLYYIFREDAIVQITNPEILRGYKWIESIEYGRSYYKGYYELDLLRCLAYFLKKDSVFFDVGGHAGYIALYGSRLANQVFTFEPKESNYHFSKRIIALNSIQNILSFQMAVGSRSGKLFFENGLTSSTGKMSAKGTIPVEVISIDEFIHTNRIDKVDLVKIDVEGFGAEVLKGMVIAIEKFKPIIFYEIHNNDEFIEIKNLMSSGYCLYTTDLRPARLDSLAEQFVIALPSNAKFIEAAISY